MKTTLYTLCILLFTLSLQAQVGIGTTAPQAAFDVTSTNSGILIPRVALTSLSDISPLTVGTESELVYNTATISDVTPGFYYWGSATGPWVRFGGATGWLTTGNADITDGTNFLGTVNNFDVAFRRQNFPAGKISTSNTSFGLRALFSGSGSNNTAIGVNALRDNTANENTAIGFNALQILSSSGARFNTAVGYQAMSSATGNPTNCVAIGANALLQNTGIKNTAVGYNALQGNTSQEGNTAIGNEALNNAGGSFNTALGFQAGFASGSNNTILGYQAGTETSGNNNIVIGFQANVGGASNTVRIGNTSITNASIQVPWDSPSDRRWKDNIKNCELGLNFIQTLRPVSYFRKNDENQRTEYGFIAQELEEALVKVGVLNNGIISKDDEGMYSVRYNDFIPMTIKAVQEQQSQIETLQKENEDLKKINEAILNRLDVLEKKTN